MGVMDQASRAGSTEGTMVARLYQGRTGIPACHQHVHKKGLNLRKITLP